MSKLFDFMIDMCRKQQEDYLKLQNMTEHARQIAIENEANRQSDPILRRDNEQNSDS